MAENQQAQPAPEAKKDRKLTKWKARVTEFLRRKEWRVYLFDNYLRNTWAVSEADAVNNVWHSDIVPKYKAEQMDEAKEIRFHMSARLEKRKKGPSHSKQRSLFPH